MELLEFTDIVPSKDRIVEKMAFEEDEDIAIVTGMIEKFSAFADPKCVYDICDVTFGENVAINGVEIEFPFVKDKLAGHTCAVPYIITCGLKTDECPVELTDPLEEYVADLIKLEYLYQAVAKTKDYIKNRIFPDGMSALNPGSLQEYPITEQKNLFRMLGGEDKVRDVCGVTLAPSFLMRPIKSTSGIFFQDSSGYENCELCPRDNCPNRRKPRVI